MITGQKVVCIDAKFSEGIRKLYTDLPVEGVVYVVRGVYVGVGYMTGLREEGEVGVYLIGLNNPRNNVPPFRERGFAAVRFKPLEEMKEANVERKEDEVRV